MNFKVFILIALLGLTMGGCATIGEKRAEVDQNSPEVFYQKALISSNYGLDDEAIKYLTEALALDPEHFPSLYLLGLTHMNQGNLSQARSAFEKCLEIEPQNAEIHARLGSIFQGMGMDKEAESEFEKAFNLDQSFVSSFNLAQFNLRRDNLEMAIKYIRTAIEKNGASGPAYNIQGVILNKSKRYPEAITSFLNALYIDGNDHIAAVNLGIAYINNREYDKARDVLTKTLSLTQDPTLKERIKEYLEAIKNIDL